MERSNCSNYIIPFIDERHRQGSKPSLRGIAYALETMRIVPKNKHTLQRLTRAMSNARRGYLNRITGKRGPTTIAMNALSDNSRKIIKDFDDREWSLEDYIEIGITHFKKLPEGFKTLVPRWLDQPIYVEVWVEKQNMAPDVTKALNGRQIVIAPNRGSVSITFIHENIERLIDQFTQNKRQKVYVLYLGDLDPPGFDMDRRAKADLQRQTREALSHEELYDEQGEPRFVFKRMALTNEQLEQFNLMHLKRTDPETLAKLKDDKNLAQRFTDEFGGLFQIELEALQSIPFSQFQKMITDEVDKLYDKAIHEQVLARPEYSQKPYEIKQHIREALTDFLYEL